MRGLPVGLAANTTDDDDEEFWSVGDMAKSVKYRLAILLRHRNVGPSVELERLGSWEHWSLGEPPFPPDNQINNQTI